MHDWSDTSFDWTGLHKAELVLEKTLKFYRVPVRDIKEKRGSIRCYTGLGWNSFHDVTHPGYAYGQYPNWLWLFNIYYSPYIMKYSGLAYLSYKLHCWAYRRAYKKAIKAAPHLKKEITIHADYPELLEGL